MKTPTYFTLLCSLLVGLTHAAYTQAALPTQCPHVDTLTQTTTFEIENSKHGPVAIDYGKYGTKNNWVLVVTKPHDMPKEKLLGYANSNLKTLQVPVSLSPKVMPLPDGSSYAICSYPMAKNSKINAMLVSPPTYYVKNVL
jgi:hypothetical protein